MNYFSNRTEAGALLADQIADQYSGDNTLVIALSEGAVLVGAEIAKRIHSSLYIFASQKVAGDSDGEATALGSAGVFSYNTAVALGALEEDAEAFRMYTDQRSLNEFLKLNHVAGKDGTIPRQLLKRHTIILVSDGLNNALSLEIAAHFLKGIDIKKLIIATPIASGQAIDKMHILVDQIFCLRSVESFMGANHYYNLNALPDDKTVVEIMQKIVLNWNQTDTKLAANN